MSVAERLDALPFSRAHWQFVFALGLTWTVASADIAIIPFVLAPLRAEWGLSSFEIGVVASAGLLGMVIGGIIGGHLGDR
ncbi:MAG TPA: hypothetical protein VI729_09515, partial [Anaerolineales bacterium]|nr:hypothetical protein [Anaerolineales bacterium]